MPFRLTLSFMTLRSHFVRLGALTALASSMFLAGPATAQATPAQHSAATVATASAPRADIPDLCQSKLPDEADDTIDLIHQGGPYPYPEDDGVFDNREGILPDESQGYYHEYTVETPGSDDRGARRIVTGEQDEYYYTSDHYSSFSLVDFDC